MKRTNKSDKRAKKPTPGAWETLMFPATPATETEAETVRERVNAEADRICQSLIDRNLYGVWAHVPTINGWFGVSYGFPILGQQMALMTLDILPDGAIDVADPRDDTTADPPRRTHETGRKRFLSL